MYTYTGFIRGILRGVRYAKSLRVLFLHRRSPYWTTLVLYSRVVFIFNEPSTTLHCCPTAIFNCLYILKPWLWARTEIHFFLSLFLPTAKVQKKIIFFTRVYGLQSIYVKTFQAAFLVSITDNTGPTAARIQYLNGISICFISFQMMTESSTNPEGSIERPSARCSSSSPPMTWSSTWRSACSPSRSWICWTTTTSPPPQPPPGQRQVRTTHINMCPLH